jgi:hypothetical protein
MCGQSHQILLDAQAVVYGIISPCPASGRFETMSKRRDLTLGVAVFFFLLWVLFTHSHPNSWNDTSRLAAVEALVHQSTWAIDDTAFGQRTGDKVYLNGHFYSSKPPVLSAMAAAIYAGLHRVFGLLFDFTGRCDPAVSPCYCFAVLCSQPPDWAYYWITLLLVGLPSAMMLALFYRSTALHGASNATALLATGALGLGTQILPYSLVFSNHIPATACLMLGFYALLRSCTVDTQSRRFLVLAGFASALAFTFNMVTGSCLLAFAALSLLQHRRRAWPFLVGSLIPIALLAALDWWMLGDPLPPQLHTAGYDYPGSAFPVSVAGNRSAANVAEYALRILVGDHGLFTFNPILLWPVAGLGVMLCRRRHRMWSTAAAVGLASLATCLYLVLTTDNFGGLSYGPRWFTFLIPLLFFFAIPTLGSRSWLGRFLFAALAALSLFFTWQGAIAPWAPTLPTSRFLRYITSPVGRYLESLPGDAIIYATPSDVDYLPKSPAHAWHTSLREFDPSLGLLPTGSPGRSVVYVLSADDESTPQLLEATFPGGQWELNAETFVAFRVSPSAARVQPERPSEAEFAGAIRLLGCDPPPKALYPNDAVTVRLYWQALAPVEEPYTAFVHLLGPQNPSTGNPLWAQDDHQPGRSTYPTDYWIPGEVVIGTFQFAIPSDAPPGEYVLATGFYDLATLQRLGRSDTQGEVAEMYRITVTSR